MDLLKKELERKRKALKGYSKDIAASTSTKKRYLKAGELKKFQEEQEDQERQKRKSNHGNSKDMKRQRREPDDNEYTSSTSDEGKTDVKSKQEESKDVASIHVPKDEDNDNTKDTATSTTNTSKSTLKNNMSSEEITNALRELGIPIQLFGETTDEQRYQRLQEALESKKAMMAGISENDDFKLGQGHGIRNPFLEKDKDDDNANTNTSHNRKDKIEESKKEKKEEEEIDLEKDPHRGIHKFFKTQLKQWEQDLVDRPDAVKKSLAGRNETKTLKQCKDYIRPLFKLCKKRTLDENITLHLKNIVLHCQEGEFVKANDSYMDLSIGRAAWPIGVTMVGIHARSGRAKIESSNVAHVMNSESQRKYLTSVKRLMTYCQKKRTDVAPSKKVVNL